MNPMPVVFHFISMPGGPGVAPRGRMRGLFVRVCFGCGQSAAGTEEEPTAKIRGDDCAAARLGLRAVAWPTRGQPGLESESVLRDNVILRLSQRL
jgi:hypothetical protein